MDAMRPDLTKQIVVVLMTTTKPLSTRELRAQLSEDALPEGRAGTNRLSYVLGQMEKKGQVTSAPCPSGKRVKLWSFSSVKPVVAAEVPPELAPVEVPKPTTGLSLPEVDSEEVTAAPVEAEDEEDDEEEEEGAPLAALVVIGDPRHGIVILRAECESEEDFTRLKRHAALFQKGNIPSWGDEEEDEATLTRMCYGVAWRMLVGLLLPDVLTTAPATYARVPEIVESLKNLRITQFRKAHLGEIEGVDLAFTIQYE